jgi:hypothetical protein
MIRFDGNTPDDVKLWHTYIYWAREKAKFGQIKDKATIPAIADDPNNRVKDSLSLALQTIIFSSFALEYRLKRVLISMGVKLKSKETLTPLLNNFWKRLSNIDRLDKKGKCSPPTEWNNCFKDLEQLVKLRNNIAHANYFETLSSFSGAESPIKMARRYYNSVVEALRLINIGTAYETRPDEEVKEYFRPLRVDNE